MSKIKRNSNSEPANKKPRSFSDKKSDFKGRSNNGRNFKKADGTDEKKKSLRSGEKSFSKGERSGTGKTSFSKGKSFNNSSRSDGKTESRFEEKRKSFGERSSDAKRPFKKSFGESSDDKKPFRRGRGKENSESFDRRNGRSEGRRNSNTFDKKNSRSEGRNSSKEKSFRTSATDRTKDKSEKIKKSFAEKKSSVRGKDSDFSPKAYPKKTPSETTRKKTFKELDKDIEYSTPPTYNLETGKSKKGTNKSSETKKPEGELIRLNKFIANSGVCSRRDADVLIQAGEVSVNGKVITELGYKVSRADVVKFNGQNLKAEKLVYVLLNKPKDFITTTDDPDERRTVMSLVKSACRERIYPVGRLDRQTTGLLLITNDGELAKKLTHPSHNITKVYQADLDKPITEEDLEQLANGVTLEDGFAQFDTCAIVSDNRRSVGLEIHIGKNRIVRRMFEHLGYEVQKLDRVMYAGLTKKDLPRGQWRYLTEKEVIRLKHFLK